MGKRKGYFYHWHAVGHFLHAAVETVCRLLNCISVSFNVILT